MKHLSLFIFVFMLAVAGNSQELLVTSSTHTIHFTDSEIVLNQDEVNESRHSFLRYNILIFDMNDISTGFPENFPAATIPSSDLVAYSTASGDIVVESEVLVKTLALYSLNGNLLRSIQNANVINASALPRGVYILKIETEAGVSVKKIVKQ